MRPKTRTKRRQLTGRISRLDLVGVSTACSSLCPEMLDPSTTTNKTAMEPNRRTIKLSTLILAILVSALHLVRSVFFLAFPHRITARLAHEQRRRPQPLRKTSSASSTTLFEADVSKSSQTSSVTGMSNSNSSSDTLVDELVPSRTAKSSSAGPDLLHEHHKRFHFCDQQCLQKCKHSFAKLVRTRSNTSTSSCENQALPQSASKTASKSRKCFMKKRLSLPPAKPLLSGPSSPILRSPTSLFPARRTPSESVVSYTLPATPRLQAQQESLRGRRQSDPSRVAAMPGEPDSTGRSGLLLRDFGVSILSPPAPRRSRTET